jgi:hypothetical protein
MVKPAPQRTDPPPQPLSRGTTTRASAGRDNTAQPPLTSGFGTVMEMEQAMRSSTEAELGRDNGPKSTAIDRILGQQLMLLDANLALLAQRYEMLPNPARFASVPGAPDPLAPSGTDAASDGAAGWMASLVAEHLNLGRAVEALIIRRPDGQRGELILAEIARNHSEMAWMLTALLNEDAGVDRPLVPRAASDQPRPDPAGGEVDWENEGGPTMGAR